MFAREEIHGGMMNVEFMKRNVKACYGITTMGDC